MVYLIIEQNLYKIFFYIYVNYHGIKIHNLYQNNQYHKYIDEHYYYFL